MEDLFPACFGFLAVLVFFGFFAYLRYLRYRETLALAEKGLVRPRPGNGRDVLRWGIAITALGIALCIGLYPLGWSVATPGAYPLNFGPWMLLGLLPTFFGLALILIHVLTRTEEAREETPREESS